MLDKLIEGLKILQPLYGQQPYAFRDGRILVGSYEPTRLTKEQVAQLENLGWYEQEESWCFDD